MNIKLKTLASSTRLPALPGTQARRSTTTDGAPGFHDGAGFPEACNNYIHQS